MLNPRSLAGVQRAIADAGVDGWLLYDFRRINPIAAGMLAREGMMTRRIFCYIPRSGNPVAMAAGLAMLELIQEPGFHAELERKTRLLCEGFEAAAREADVPFSTNHVCGMFGLFFTAEKVETYKQAVACDVTAFNRFFHSMLGHGVYLAPSAFEAGFVSAAHSDKDIAETLLAARHSFREVRRAS